MNLHRYTLATFALIALLLGGCTQDQAPIQNKGRVAYKYGTHEEQSYASYRGDSGESSSFSEEREEKQGVFKSGYRRKAKAATVEEVGATELPDPSGRKSSRGRSAAIESSDTLSPFSATPSRPLEKKTETSELQPPSTLKEEVQDTAAGDLANRKEVAKGGISLIQPVNGGRIISRFKGAANDGINIEAAEGEPVVAAASGMVVYTGGDVKNYGNMIVLRHDNGWLTAYGNTSKIVVKKNDYVKQGDIIAFVGSTGGVKSPQLHFAVRNGKLPVDPEKYLPNN